MSRPFAALLVVAAFVPTVLAAPERAFAHDAHQHAMPKPRAAACAEPVVGCAISATPAVMRDGSLRVIYSVGGRVYVAASRDEGKTFEPGVALNAAPADVDDNYDGRPTLAVSRDGALVAAWSVWRDKAWNGKVLYSRSADGGATWSEPKPFAETVSQRFAAIAFAPDGALWATWLDKRNLAAAKAKGDDYAGAGLAVAVSRDGGATLSESRILSDRTCECCRVALAFDPDGAAVAGWRQIFGKNFRDHEVGRIAADAAALTGVRVSEDDWAIDACPHHGPTLAVDPAGARHFIWFTGGKTRSGLFYARQARDGAPFSEPEPVGDPQRLPSHPQIAATAAGLVRAWKEFDGETTFVMTQSSVDGGATWSPAQARATTSDASDHPLLLAKGGRAMLSWLTKAEGYRLLPLAVGPER